MTRYIVFFFCFAFSSVAWAQSEFEFASAQLSDISKEYAGSTNNWPIVRSLADFDYATNRFFLGSEEVQRLSEFLESWKRLEESRSVFSSLSSQGGQVFAGPELAQLDSLFTLHRSHVNDANIEDAIALTDVIVNRVEEVQQLVEDRRVADVEAKLESKTGEVNKRRGLLSEWLEAAVGELFNRSDGIRTGRESQAQLVFVDGSDVVLHENTTAIIRKSRVDQLNNRSEVEIELSSGGLLTRLTPSAQNDSEYILNAGTSTSEIRSGNFWAESDSDQRITLSNYDGQVTVGSSQSQVVIRENEGTIVVRGREPVAPIRLLPPPEMHVFTTDTVIYRNSIELSWEPITGANYYETDISQQRRFDSGVRTLRTTDTEIAVSNIPEGVSYLQVRGYDDNGLRGNNSRTLRILYIESSVPPPVILDTRNTPIAYAFERSYKISGTTEPGIRLTIDGERVSINEHGRFEHVLEIDDEKEVEIIAINNAGISREINQTVRFVDPEKLFDLQWSVPVTGNQVRKAPRILVSGEAHEFITVVISVGDQEYKVPVGSSRRWARQISTEGATNILIQFTDKNTGDIIADKTFEFSNP